MKSFNYKEMSLHQKRYIALMLALSLLGIVFLSVDTAPNDKAETYQPIVQSQTNENTEEKLAKILSQVDGAGKVAVQINYATQGEIDYAANKQWKKQTSEETAIEEQAETIAFYNSGQGTQTALITKKTEPLISGVLIVAQGADNIEVKRDLVKAAAVLFDLPDYKVTVLKMKGGVENDSIN